MGFQFPEWRMISTETMINVIQESNRNNERFCFILGSGASVESGIPFGTELENKWMAFLMGEASDDGMPPRDPNIVREYAKALKKDNLIKTDFSEIEKFWKKIKNNKESSLPSEYYFDLYTLRFYPNHKNAYRYLERLMESAEPSLGYRILARMLVDERKNNLVITTNFDSLTEDALFIYTSQKPLVINHELLADYIADSANNRPIVAKIHRGLFFTPLNSRTDTDELKKEWIEALSSVFGTYTPIVIGYGGGDHSLMDFLQDENTKIRNGFYWCYLPQYGLPNEGILKLIKEKNGYLVSIDGFDAFMASVGSQMYPNDIDPNRTNELLNQQCYSRIDQYNKRWNELHSQSRQINDMKYLALDAEKKREESKSLSYFDYFNRGIRYMSSNQFKQAIKFFDKAIEENDSFAPAYSHRGSVYGSLGEYKKAISDYDIAIKLNPANSVTYNNRGVVYDNLGEYIKAINDYDKAIELNPNNSTLYNHRGDTYYSLGEYKKAIADFEKAIELKPDYSEAYNNRGYTYDSLGEYKKAIADYDKAIELMPNDSTVYNNRGGTYDILGEHEKAIADYDKAIELKPDYSEAYNNRGNAYDSLGEHKKAIADYDKAIELKPDYPNPYRHYGDVYNILKKYDEAVVKFTKAIELNPKYREAYIGRAKAYRALGKIELAEKDEKMAEQLN